MTTLDELTRSTGFSKDILHASCHHELVEFAFFSFHIAKRSGGTREIRAPGPELLKVLHGLHAHFQSLNELLHDGAHGFRPEHSVLSNALPHCNRAYVLNVDLRNFFTSIPQETVERILRKPPLNFDREAAETIAAICCDQGALPQGSPLSPLLSNVACIELDTELDELARKNDCYYTRYADDITFSTSQSRFPTDVASIAAPMSDAVQLSPQLLQILGRSKLHVNYDKVRIHTQDQRQEVTGLRVNHRPLVRTKLLRQIRSSLHAIERFGIHACEQRLTEAKPELGSFRNRLLGQLSFASFIHGPGESSLRRLEHRAAKTGLMPLAPHLDAPNEEQFWQLRLASNVVPLPSIRAVGFRTENGLAVSRSVAERLATSRSKENEPKTPYLRLKQRRPPPCEGEACFAMVSKAGSTCAVPITVNLAVHGTEVRSSALMDAELIAESALVLDLRGQPIGFLRGEKNKFLLEREYMLSAVAQK